MTAATILVADDDSAIRTVLHQALARAGYNVRTTGTAAGLWKMIQAGEGSVAITDVVLPDESGFDLIPRIKRLRPELPVLVMSAQNTLLTAITAAERGAFEYLPKPFDLKELTNVVQRALASPGARREEAPAANEDRLPLIGRSPAMQEIYRVIARLTQTDLTVMIMGESGTGKELVARALHDYGKRRHGRFTAVNMAAIPKELVESELFGHERGAFTGATNRGVGRFEQADGGTLFLDEIGDMPLEAQTRLLRVLQQGEYTTVGGRTPIRTDVRIIAATNRDLRQLIGQGLFREDLYYRINVVPLRLPPLRERAEDIPDLVRFFLRKAEGEGLPAKSLDADGLEILRRHRWPGNVRELENLVRRLVVLHAGEIIPASAIAGELKEPARAIAAEAEEEALPLGAAVEQFLTRYFLSHGDRLPPPGVYDRIIQEVERPLISICLGATRGNQIRAAQLLGLNRNTLRKKIRDLGLEVIKGLRAE
ncbi:MAG TPA: nitrogen regulation protein NR(I) [Rhizomicrobium sp.]|jgi:two-component system nitrogen regulation response regulator GlnG